MDLKNNNSEPVENNELSIELSEEIAEGIYSNLAIITHSNTEFVLDFIRIMPGIPKAKVKSRIVLTPEHAKRLLGALQDNINRFEDGNGPIKTNDPALPMNLAVLLEKPSTKKDMRKRRTGIVLLFFYIPELLFCNNIENPIERSVVLELRRILWIYKYGT